MDSPELCHVRKSSLFYRMLEPPRLVKRHIIEKYFNDSEIYIRGNEPGFFNEEELARQAVIIKAWQTSLGPREASRVHVSQSLKRNQQQNSLQACPDCSWDYACRISTLYVGGSWEIL